MGARWATKLKRVAIIDNFEGNGHCFSFPAIMNGWDPRESHLCPFPSIPEYLLKHSAPNAEVKKIFNATSVWLQEPNQAKNVFAFAKLKHVASTPLGAIDNCDVVFLLNDEPDSRNFMLKTLIPLGKPIFVDKLLSRHTNELDEICNAQVFENQIFSASAMKYSPVFDALSPFCSVSKTHIKVPKSWRMYGIHAIEMFLNSSLLLDCSYEIVNSHALEINGGQIVRLAVKSASKDLSSEVFLEASGKPNTVFSVSQVGRDGEETEVVMNDPFWAFVRMILDFKSYTESNYQVTQYWLDQRRAIEILSR